VKKIASWMFFLALASAAPLLAQVTFTASPNPLPAGVNVVTISWNAPASTSVDVHLNSPTGVVFASGGSTGSAPTGAWAYPGLAFYLVDNNTGVTLATLTLTSVATISVTPNPVPSGVTSVTVSWSAPGYTVLDVHLSSASGTLVWEGGSTGSEPWPTPTPGQSFYLVDHVSGTFLASVSILGDWDIPTANQSQCLPFAVLSEPATAGPQGYVTCWRVGYFPWYAIGGAGWTTGLTLSNSTSSDIPIQLAIGDKNGNPYAPTGATVNGAALALGAGATDARILPAHSMLRYVFPNNDLPETDGQIYFQALAKDGLSLNTIQATEDYSLYYHGITYSTVTLPIAWVDQATTSYSSFFEESTSDSSIGTFAIKEMSGSAQNVDVKVFDVNGNQLGDQSVALAGNQTIAFEADSLFGASTLENRSPVPIVRIQFTGTGAISVLLLQVRGQSIATVLAQPVLEH